MDIQVYRSVERFPVRVRLLAMRRGELSLVIAWLKSVKWMEVVERK